MHVLLPADQLLPPACPACGAPGMHPRPVVRPLSLPRRAPLTAHYCDLCAERLARRTTLAHGLLAAGLLFELSCVTALTLHWGTHRVFSQALIAVACGAALAALWIFFGPPPVDHFGLVEDGETREGRRFVATSPRFASELVAVVPGGRRLNESNSGPRRRWGIWSTMQLLGLLPLLGGLLWLSSLQFFGGVRLRVLSADPSRLVLLVDGRQVASVLGTRYEDPEAGQFVRVLGGRRELRLLKSDGTEVTRQVATLWPGRSYVVGQLPAGRCLFVETRSYGAMGSDHTLAASTDSAPLWEFDAPIDSWFQPLPPEGRQEISGLRGSGGKRTALRLLSCSTMR